MRDKPYGTYSTYTALKTGLWVTCPRCGGMGLVTSDGRVSRFRCTKCAHAEVKEHRGFRHRVQNLCQGCGRFYNVPILDRRRQSFPVLRVSCPYCGTVMPGRVEKTQEHWVWVSKSAQRGRDPIFGFRLWFLTEFDGHLVWALDREHLNYLIDYLGASLREKPLDWPGGRTQDDALPTFMKRAKNRERLVKKLQKLQQKFS